MENRSNQKMTSTLKDPLTVEKPSTDHKEKVSPKMGPLQPQISINFEKDKIEAKRLEKEKKKQILLNKKKKLTDDKENEIEDMNVDDKGQRGRKVSIIGDPPDEIPIKPKKKKVSEVSDENHPLKPVQNKESVKYVKGITDKHSNIQSKESVKNVLTDNSNVRKPNERSGKGNP